MENTTHGVYWVFQKIGGGTGAGSDVYRPEIGILASAGQGTDRGALHYIKTTNNLGASYPYYQGPTLTFYDLTSGTAYVNNVAEIMAFQANGTSGWGVWRNSTLEGTTSQIFTPNNSNVGYSLGGQYSTSRRSNIVISEVIMIEVTSQNNRLLIEGYLAWKWGLVVQLRASHPFKNRPPEIGD